MQVQVPPPICRDSGNIFIDLMQGTEYSKPTCSNSGGVLQEQTGSGGDVDSLGMVSQNPKERSIKARPDQTRAASVNAVDAKLELA